MSIDPSNQAQAELWGGAGPVWHRLQARLDAQVDEHGLTAIDALAPAPGEVVLDVGCGTGTSTFQLAERVGAGGFVQGLDISQTMVDAATARAGELGVTNVAFGVGDAQVEPFEPVADAAFSRFGVMFFADSAAAFANIGTALCPGGRLGFVCWQGPERNPWASRPMAAAMEHLDMALSRDPGAPGPFALADADALAATLAGAGFAAVDIAGHDKAVNLGPTVGEATEFMMQLNPGTAGLAAADPDLAGRVRDAIADVLADSLTDRGVECPSATWVVTATRTG